MKGDNKMGLATAAAVAAIVGGVAAVGGATYSGINAAQQNRRAKHQAEAQQAEIDKQKAVALEQRKNQIDAQRMQLGGTGRGTRGSSSTGVKARISTSNETLG